MSFVAGFDDDAPKCLPIPSPPMHALSALQPKPILEHMEQSMENTSNRTRRRESMVERSTSEKTMKKEIRSMPLDRHCFAPPSPPSHGSPTKRCIDAIVVLEVSPGDVWTNGMNGIDGKGPLKHEKRPFFTTHPPPWTLRTPPLPLSRVSYTMVEVSREEEKVCRAIWVCLTVKTS